jgi:hypothetical protein
MSGLEEIAALKSSSIDVRRQRTNKTHKNITAQEKLASSNGNRSFAQDPGIPIHCLELA